MRFWFFVKQLLEALPKDFQERAVGNHRKLEYRSVRGLRNFRLHIKNGENEPFKEGRVLELFGVTRSVLGNVFKKLHEELLRSYLC